MGIIMCHCHLHHKHLILCRHISLAVSLCNLSIQNYEKGIIATRYRIVTSRKALIELVFVLMEYIETIVRRQTPW